MAKKVHTRKIAGFFDKLATKIGKAQVKMR